MGESAEFSQVGVKMRVCPKGRRIQWSDGQTSDVSGVSRSGYTRYDDNFPLRKFTLLYFYSTKLILDIPMLFEL